MPSNKEPSSKRQQGIKLLNPQQINEIFCRFRSANEKPVTELQAPNDFTLLVSVVLSAQATNTIVKVTENWQRNSVSYHEKQVLKRMRESRIIISNNSVK